MMWASCGFDELLEKAGAPDGQKDRVMHHSQLNLPGAAASSTSLSISRVVWAAYHPDAGWAWLSVSASR